MLSELVLRVRHAIYHTFAEGGLPLSAAIADNCNLPADDVRLAYTRLSEAHAIVLDPHSKEVRMALPFSAVPTAHLVTGGGRSWYANCTRPDLVGAARIADRRHRVARRSSPPRP
jgi:hypothetical protein